MTFCLTFAMTMASTSTRTRQSSSNCYCALADLSGGSHRSSTIAKPATLMIHPMTTTTSSRR